jgi:small subunit ribosomal protein S2
MLKKNKVISISSLFKIKFHIGENKEKWNPLIKNYVFGFRHGVYFFNLNKTLLLLKKLIYLFKKVSQYHQIFLFVGTNPLISGVISLISKILKQPCITKKWVGGTLTNWLRIKPYIKFLYKTSIKDIRKKFVLRTEQKIQQKINRYTKMKHSFKGVENMKFVPNLIVILDSERINYTFLESKKLNIPIIALASTFSNINSLSYPILGNNKNFSSFFFCINIIFCAIKTGEKIKRLNLLKYSNKLFGFKNKKSLNFSYSFKYLLYLCKCNKIMQKYKNYSNKLLSKHEFFFVNFFNAILKKIKKIMPQNVKHNKDLIKKK